MSAIISTSNQILKVASNAAWTPASITVECWLKFVSDPSDYGYAVSHGTEWTIYSSDSSGANNMKPTAYWQNTTPTAYRKVATSAFVTDVWHHVAMLAPNSNTLELFIDGVSQGTTATSGSINTTTKAIWFGSNPDDATVRNIKLSDVRVWSTIRTPTQITNNKLIRLAGNESGLLGYWKLNETSGNTADDLTSNNRDATATTASWDGTDNPNFPPEAANNIIFFN